jgi:hypothetical protein
MEKRFLGKEAIGVIVVDAIWCYKWIFNSKKLQNETESSLWIIEDQLND